MHGPILRRPTKNRHRLRANLASFTWSPEVQYHRTLCGIFLYQRPDMAAEYTRIDETFPDAPTEQFRAMLALSERPGFRYPPEPCDIPGVDVFYQVGWDRQEILIAAMPTCKSCLKSCSKKATSPSPQ